MIWSLAAHSQDRVLVVHSSSTECAFSLTHSDLCLQRSLTKGSAKQRHFASTGRSAHSSSASRGTKRDKQSIMMVLASSVPQVALATLRLGVERSPGAASVWKSASSSEVCCCLFWTWREAPEQEENSEASRPHDRGGRCQEALGANAIFPHNRIRFAVAQGWRRFSCSVLGRASRHSTIR